MIMNLPVPFNASLATVDLQKRLWSMEWARHHVPTCYSISRISNILTGLIFLWILQQRKCFGTPATWMTLNPQQPSSFSVIYVGQICYVALINEKGFHQPAGCLQKVIAVNGMLTHMWALFYSEGSKLDDSQVMSHNYWHINIYDH
jgi:hypothetical protein